VATLGLAGALTVGGGALLTWITGNLLSAEHAVYQLPGMLLFTASMGLFAALYLHWLAFREQRALVHPPAGPERR